MRLWTVHPRHLDAKGLVALWREALLAQKVLQGGTRGYRHHPQLLRFLAAPRPAAALARYLAVVHEESVRRGYHFDARKIGAERSRGLICETRGQLLYEWAHLQRKLVRRDPARFRASRSVLIPDAHPLFRIVPGGVRGWEKAPGRRTRVPRPGKRRTALAATRSPIRRRPRLRAGVLQARPLAWARTERR